MDNRCSNNLNKQTYEDENSDIVSDKLCDNLVENNTNDSDANGKWKACKMNGDISHNVD